MLPIEFQKRMQEMLQEEYDSFLSGFEKPRFHALRRNPLKIGKTEFEDLMPFALTPVPWATTGYYYENDIQPGKHEYHEAGLYYIQEPSAMSVVEYLEIKPGEYILDLCAAPGGKTTQIAGFLQGDGLLICNEIHPQRAKILSENIERMGVKNALVTNETPQRLSAAFPGYFDKILVDAPCSGEGMFRKNEEALDEWSPENVQMCADRQDEILEEVAKMLRPGGRICYSTCTFAPAENEECMARFLQKYPQFHLIEVEKKGNMSAGEPKYSKVEAEGLEKTIRLWPHKLDGEGHFIAVLEKDGILEEEHKPLPKNGFEKAINEKEYREYRDFENEFLKIHMEQECMMFGEQLYAMPANMPALKGLKVLRPGLHLGTMKKKRFEPSHALALALKPKEVRYTWDLKSGSLESKQYLSGQTFAANGEKGWYLITVDGYSLGWGKLAGGIMKNHYPKGLRKNW
ncbi:MAG: RsmB/NOP family class I SAM-dependent RNA methyltransferase [Lachnospiraceae bacterium]|nr:RsmB/NOP family class I SAM-dependent RNA methyltransferase [Lachnospiraceae bacterium]